MPWLEPDWEDATRNAVQVVERYWHKYVPLKDNRKFRLSNQALTAQILFEDSG